MPDGKAEFEAALAAMLTARLPGCTEFVSCERLSGGASQETYRIRVMIAGQEKTVAMRRAPGGAFDEAMPAHPGLDVEAMLMQCAREVGVPEPEVFHVLTAEDGLGSGFVMEWLEGEALGARIVRSDEFAALRPKLARECGRILAKIHGIDLAATGLDKRLGVIPPDEFVEQMWERYKLFNTPQPMIDYAARWLRENLPADFEMALVHNDFRNGNFMVNSEEIVAVLDWEVAHIGDPMRDLGWICTNSWRFNAEAPVGGFGQYEDLFQGYEEVSGKTVDPRHVKFWEVFGSYWWAVGCMGFAEHYRTGPDKTVERPAVGRRTSECQVDCVNLLIPGPVTLVSADEEPVSDMPRADELLQSVTDFLRDDVMAATTGRNNFMARVASNSLDIVSRELKLGAAHRQGELARLRQIYASDADLNTLRWKLVNELRDGSLSLDDEALKSHLRETVVNQVAIDQPRYSGFRRALKS